MTRAIRCRRIGRRSAASGSPMSPRCALAPMEKADRFDAGVTAMDADMAESYALDAIDFAQDAVDEAESAVLDAMYTRADAEALRT